MLAARQEEMHDSSLLQMVAPRRIECRAPPPPPQSSRAAATAAWQVPLRAPCSRRPRRLLLHAARARASRQRAPRAAAHERRLRLLRPCAGAIGCSHAAGSVGVANRARARVENSTVLAFGRTEDSTHTHWCGALVRQRLGGKSWRQRTSARTAHSCAASRE